MKSNVWGKVTVKSNEIQGEEEGNSEIQFGREGVMKPPLPVPEPLMLLLVAYLAWSLELD